MVVKQLLQQKEVAARCQKKMEDGKTSKRNHFQEKIHL